VRYNPYMLKNASLSFIGFLQATTLLLYVMLVTTVMRYLEDKVPEDDNDMFAGIIFILLFVVSAVISAGIVLGRAGQLYFHKQQKPAYHLVGWTVGWTLAYFAMFVLLVAL